MLPRHKLKYLYPANLAASSVEGNGGSERQHHVALPGLGNAKDSSLEPPGGALPREGKDADGLGTLSRVNIGLGTSLPARPHSGPGDGNTVKEERSLAVAQADHRRVGKKAGGNGGASLARIGVGIIGGAFGTGNEVSMPKAPHANSRRVRRKRRLRRRRLVESAISSSCAEAAESTEVQDGTESFLKERRMTY